MATTLSASHVVDGDPATILLLITGPSAAGFLPETVLDESVPGQVSGTITLADGTSRALHVVTSPPRRTPVAYLSEFRVQVDGMPPATGALQVTSAGPAQSNVLFSLRADTEIPAEFTGTFDTVAQGFFDGLQRAAREQSSVA
jgi:hypothetical protein